jgi:membrane-bound ClpP family serine protease
VVLTVLAVGLLSTSYQRGGVSVLTGIGLGGLAVAGLAFTDAAPQITPSLLGVAGTVAAAGFFFLLAMPTVARARFSTQTIGRDHLLGVEGRAVVDLTPDGIVEVAGARWRASSHREAGIRGGDPVVVVGVDGEYLEVDRRS